MSEEFGGALPSVVMAEAERLPVGFMEQIVEYRRYNDAWSALQVATTSDARMLLRRSTFGALAEEIAMELAAEDLAGG